MVMYRKVESPSLSKVTLQEWYAEFSADWRQGEHVELIGPTGTGKTTVAHAVLDIRTYVCVLAVKKSDDTLDRFRDGHRYGRQNYKIITRWPPDYPYKRLILWIKPKSIVEREDQAKRVHVALNWMYLEGGWCIYFDEAGYIAGQLGLGGALGVLLNQGRSSYLSIVATATRATSLVARIPRETLSMPRHKLFFKYTDENEIKACAQVAGIDTRQMIAYMQALRFLRGQDGSEYTDFLYCKGNRVLLVLNEGSL